MDDRSLLEEQLERLNRRLDHLESLIQSQTQRVYALERQMTPGKVDVSSSPPSTPPFSFERGVETTASSPPLPAPEKEDRSSPVSSVRTPRAVHSRLSVTRESLESQIGGNWLNKVGVVAIVLGMALFLKYAIDNRWIGEMGRVILGVVTGLGFLVWGEKLHGKLYRGYGLTISGGGIAILYFSIFAAFSFYNLISQLPAFFMMVLITTTAVMMAVKHDAKIIAILGILGGFLTPAMLSTGKDNQLGLFSYILLLDLGILALAYFKNWRGVNLLAFVLTQLTFLGWTISFYSEAKLWRTEFFLTLFFTVFAVISFLYNIAHQRKTSFRDLSLILLNGTAYFLWTYSLLEPRYFHYLGFYAVLMAVIYVGLGSVARRRAAQDNYLILIFLGMSLTALTLAIPIQLKQNWITIGWALEALILSWVGFHADSRKTRWAALFIAFLVAVRLLGYDSVFSQGFVFLWNKRALTFLVCVSAIFAMAALYARNWSKLPKEEIRLIAGLVVAANLLLLFFLTTEIMQFFQVRYVATDNYTQRRDLHSRQQLSVSALWGFYSIVLVTIGIMRKFQPIRLLAILLFALTILKVFFVDLQEMEKIYRIVASIGLGILLLTVSLMYQRYRNQINDFVMK